ncbi:DUF6199 family natural product biosynthesis protein [Gordonia sp. (in: high G+C Gram-positive bacteria)]|uniref:DUF6199 family natural product biosynthesis protein n=1 Tax=Gordonia sp. (in: high G+C Gram-positive bacteria) TaxID=84139 RepID=UPI00352871A3
MGFFILVLFIAVPLALWGIIDPKGAWRATESWKFKNPDANEPSEAAYAMSRIGGVFALVMLVIGGVMLYNVSRDASSRRADSTSPGTVPSYQSPEIRSLHKDLGAGTLVGYRYPSELTLEFVVLDSGRRSGFPAPSCDTGVSVYEHTNAIVVEVTRSAHVTTWSDEADVQPQLEHACDGVVEKPSTIRRQFDKPLGGRPILTAAPMVDPATVGLAYAGRPAQPLEEVAKPGVKQPLRPVTIDPAWQPVPLLAPAPAA